MTLTPEELANIKLAIKVSRARCARRFGQEIDAEKLAREERVMRGLSLMTALVQLATPEQ